PRCDRCTTLSRAAGRLLGSGRSSRLSYGASVPGWSAPGRWCCGYDAGVIRGTRSTPGRPPTPSPATQRRPDGSYPPLDDLVSQLPGPLEAGGVEHGADVLGERLLVLPADLPEGVASDVHLATLPGYALEVPVDGVDQAAVIVAGD